MIEHSGPQWCDRFPTSTSLGDLAEPFGGNVTRFTNALAQAGVDIHVSATYRPPQRAYLMHYACMIAMGVQDPAAVPPAAGVEIDWSCGDSLHWAKAQAESMCHGYGIRFPATLVSRHTQRLAIDMTLRGWQGKTVKLPTDDLAGGSLQMVLGSEAALWEAGKAYGVIKLKTDPPHWSSDGH